MYKISLFILILAVFSSTTAKYDDTDEEFLDIGVQLTGDNSDVLVADLIAEEKNFLNVGHVSDLFSLFLIDSFDNDDDSFIDSGS